MRAMFNEDRYWERAQGGEFTQAVREERPAPPESGEPPGTLSQSISYLDRQNEEIARVHQYLRADGSIGASGRPDPKRILKDGVLYRLLRKASEETEGPSPT